MSQPGTFIAAYPFSCACCGTRYRAGVRAAYNEDGEVVMVGCPDSGRAISKAEQEKARRGKCPRCFLVHAPHQGEECA